MPEVCGPGRQHERLSLPQPLNPMLLLKDCADGCALHAVTTLVACETVLAKADECLRPDGDDRPDVAGRYRLPRRVLRASFSARFGETFRRMARRSHPAPN